MAAARGAGRHGVGVERHTGELRQLGCRLMPELQQPQSRDQRQQGPVGHRSRVIDRVGLAAKSEGQGLGGFGAGEVIRGVPGQRQHRHQQQRKRQPGRQSRVDPRAEQSDEDRTQPIRHGCRIGRHAAHHRHPPRRPAVGHADHVAERGHIGVAPRVTPKQPRQHVGGTEQQQGPARQTLHGTLRNQSGIQ